MLGHVFKKHTAEPVTVTCKMGNWFALPHYSTKPSIHINQHAKQLYAVHIEKSTLFCLV